MTENFPANWRLTTLNNVCDLFRGVSYKKSDAHNIKKENACLILRGGNIKDGFIITETENVYVDKSLVKPSQFVKKNDVIIVASTASLKVIGRAAVSNFDFENISFGAFLILLRPLQNICPGYFGYFFQTDFYRNLIRTFAAGTNINNIKAEHLQKIEIPVPPLAEQKRIVEKIDFLFAKLNLAQDKLKDVLRRLELHKVYLLKKAFDGTLTAEFRANTGISKDDWQEKRISDVCKSLIYGTSKKSKPEGKIIVIRMGNLQNGQIDWKNLAYSDDEEDIKKYKLSAGDVLFNRTNSAELVGKTSIYCGEYPAIYAGYLIKLDYDREILCGEFLNYVLNSLDAKKYCHQVKTDGVNQSNINAKKIGAYIIPLPPLAEQKEIARLLDNLLTKENRVKEIAEKSLQQIDALKKNILARAFRGELGTNAPAEKPVEEI